MTRDGLGSRRRGQPKEIVMQRTMLSLSIAAAVLIAVIGCDSSDPAPTTASAKSIVALCGAGLRPAMEPIRTEFERVHGCEVRVTYAGSGTLLGSLQAGTHADVFLPGDAWYVEKIAEKDMVDSQNVAAWFVPVIAVRKGNPKGIKGLAHLARKDISVGLGKATACAIGNTSAQLLAEKGLAEKVKPSFEALTVNRLANQIKMKALDATIIWDATAAQYPDDIDVVAIDDAYFHAVALSAAALKQSKDIARARQFIEFAAGDYGAKSFRDNSYQVPGKKLRLGCGSSMRPPAEDLAKLFEDRTGCEVLRDYGGSGTVLLQIEQSKEGDVYICHDPYAYVCEDKKISAGWHPIALLHPALAVKKGNPKKVKGLNDLLRSDLKIGLPHRDKSTRGMMLWAMLKKMGIDKQVAKREFYESRTHDLISQLKLGTVDIAVLWDAPVRADPGFEAIPIEPKYRVDSVTSASSRRTYSLEHVKVTVVRMTFAKEPLLAAQFAKLCQSRAGRRILARHKFDLPAKP